MSNSWAIMCCVHVMFVKNDRSVFVMLCMLLVSCSMILSLSHFPRDHLTTKNGQCNDSNLTWFPQHKINVWRVFINACGLKWSLMQSTIDTYGEVSAMHVA